MTRAALEALHQPVSQVAVGLRIGTTPEGVMVPDRPVGTLTLEGTRPVFVYDPAFLTNPLPLSPLQLPAHAGTYRHADLDFEPLPGLLADALPDGWGRLLHDRAYARAGRALDTARFDRAGPGGRQRIHVHTAGGLLHASFRVPSLDYSALFQLTGALTRSPAQLRELFRRMVFNVYAYNRDDHAKNFAFRMAADSTWTLAPTYDLMFSPGMHGRHATAIDGVDDWPMRAGLLRLGEQHRLARRDLEQDFAQVREVVAAGPALAREWGCARTTCAMLQARFEEIARRAHG